MSFVDFYKSNDWCRIKLLVYEMYEKRCMKCGVCNVEMHVDHIVPRSIEQDLELNIHNLQVLCRKCNYDKLHYNTNDYRTNSQRNLCKNKYSECYFDVSLYNDEWIFDNEDKDWNTLNCLDAWNIKAEYYQKKKFFKKKDSDAYLEKRNQLIIKHSPVVKSYQEDGVVCFCKGKVESNNIRNSPLSYAFVITDNGNIIHEYGQKLEIEPTSTARADIISIVKCLEYLIFEGITSERVVLMVDSQWVQEYCFANYEIWNKDTIYYQSLVELKELISLFDDLQCIWIPKELNLAQELSDSFLK